MDDRFDGGDGRVDARGEARSIAERIDDLRARGRGLTLAAENERESGPDMAEGTPEAGHSEFIVTDFEEQAEACRDEIGRLRKLHDELMGPYSNFATWEEKGVAEYPECGGRLERSQLCCSWD